MKKQLDASVKELTRERDEAETYINNYVSACKDVGIQLNIPPGALPCQLPRFIGDAVTALTAENAELKKTNERAQELLLAADADIASRSRLQIATDKELESVTAENARLREDKARLDWLENEMGIRIMNMIHDAIGGTYEDLRAAIDAALQPKPETKEGE